MVGAIVHRPVSSLWRPTLSLRAPAPHDDHGESAATVLRHSGVAAVLRRAHGPLDPFSADDGAAEQRRDLRRYARRRAGGGSELVELTPAHAASFVCSRAAFQFQAKSSA